MNIMPSEEISFFNTLFLRKRTAHAQRNNGIDDFHILQLKPITKKSALKPKTQIRKKMKYLTPGRACELGSENKPVATRATAHWKTVQVPPKMLYKYMTI